MTTHIREHAAMGRDGLPFAAAYGEQLAPSTLYRVFYPAHKKAGRALSELVAGHVTPSAATNRKKKTKACGA